MSWISDISAMLGRVLVPIVIVMIAVAIVLTIKYIASRYKKIPPGRVGIFYGRKYKWPDGTVRGFLIVTGGGRVLMPLFESYLELPTTAFQVMINEQNIPNKDNVKLTVPGVATCKISTEPANLNRAIEALIDKMSQDDIKKGTDHTALEEFVLNILKGHLRSIIGKLDINELLRNRDEFNKRVMTESEEELQKFGIDLMNLVIQDIRDDQGYIDALGKRAVAEVKAEAEIKTAEALRGQNISVSNAQREAAVVTAQNEATIASANRDRDLKQAGFKEDVAKAQAKANMAGQIENAAQEQTLRVAEAARDAAAAEAGVKVQEKEAERKEKELLVTVIKPAEAKRQSTVIEAEATKSQRILNAEAEAAALTATAEARRNATTLEGQGEAAATEAKLVAKAKGDAASARETLLAQAEGTERLNAALANMTPAAKMILILDRAPNLIEKLGDGGAKVVGAMFAPIAAGLGQIDSIRIVDMGGKGDGINKMSNVVTETVFNVLAQLKAKGIDLDGLLKMAGINTAGLREILDGVSPAAPEHRTDTSKQ